MLNLFDKNWPHVQCALAHIYLWICKQIITIKIGGKAIFNKQREKKNKEAWIAMKSLILIMCMEMNPIHLNVLFIFRSKLFPLSLPLPLPLSLSHILIQSNYFFFFLVTFNASLRFTFYLFDRKYVWTKILKSKTSSTQNFITKISLSTTNHQLRGQ